MKTSNRGGEVPRGLARGESHQHSLGLRDKRGVGVMDPRNQSHVVKAGNFVVLSSGNRDHGGRDFPQETSRERETQRERERDSERERETQRERERDTQREKEILQLFPLLAAPVPPID